MWSQICSSLYSHIHRNQVKTTTKNGCVMLSCKFFFFFWETWSKSASEYLEWLSSHMPCFSWLETRCGWLKFQSLCVYIFVFVDWELGSHQTLKFYFVLTFMAWIQVILTTIKCKYIPLWTKSQSNLSWSLVLIHLEIMHLKKGQGHLFQFYLACISVFASGTGSISMLLILPGNGRFLENLHLALQSP